MSLFSIGSAGDRARTVPSLGLARCRLIRILFALECAAIATIHAAAPDTSRLPTFLQAGARISYEAGDSTIAGTNWVRDDEHGFVKMADGHWYRPEESHQSGGVGVLQINILTATPALIAADAASYLNVDLANGTVITSSSAGLTGTADGLGDYWIHPARLTAMQAGRDIDGTETSRGKYELNGRTYSVVTIRRGGRNGYSTNSYDVDTGLLVSGGSVVADPSVRITDPNGAAQGTLAGNTSYSHARFLGVRQTKIPWAAAPLPADVVPGRRFDYQGGERNVMQQLPGLPQLPPLPARPMAISVSVGNAIANSVQASVFLRADLGPSMPPSEVSAQRCFGSAMFNGLWIGPSAASALQPNQVLDEDPFTRFRIIFVGVQGNMILVVEQGARETNERWYDGRSGLLMGMRLTRQQPPIGQTVAEYQLARR